MIAKTLIKKRKKGKKKVVKEIVVFGKLFQTIVVSMAKKTENGNNQNCIKVLFSSLIRKGATTTTKLENYLGQLWFP